LTEQERNSWDALDEAARMAGGYLAAPKRPLVVDADYRAMSRYCREKGVKPMELTEDERKKFLYDKPLVYA
jgi:hypothetical protein